MRYKEKLMTIILLEGPDVSGKTTLAEKFVKRGYHYIHSNYSPGIDIQGYHTEKCAEAHANQPSVVDQLHLSEFIYAKVFRNGEFYGWRTFDFFDRVPDIKIICLPPFSQWRNTLIRRIAGQEKIFDDIAKHVQVYEEYKQYLKHHNDWHLYDFTNPSAYVEDLCDLTDAK
jgi:hypothetical protein